ncbi:hypothetical protein CLV70_104291 [Pseudosporangium ferrugineum]|uniref:Uncharacterized protein n=1 Tax=Pseudosporangium ferrugineum TaxID=439699 RepID=A0A2T0SBD5_9ACTN|nr:hypothetical protein CLV70_104291 [Pseudosporangium ferrugineum]
MAERLVTIDLRRHGDKAWSKAVVRDVIGADGEPVR